MPLSSQFPHPNPLFWLGVTHCALLCLRACAVEYLEFGLIRKVHARAFASAADRCSLLSGWRGRSCLPVTLWSGLNFGFQRRQTTSAVCSGAMKNHSPSPTYACSVWLSRVGVVSGTPMWMSCRSLEITIFRTCEAQMSLLNLCICCCSWPLFDCWLCWTWRGGASQ